MDKEPSGTGLPERWQRELAPRLKAGETVLGWFEPDLDRELHYGQEVVVLTDLRLLGGMTPSAAKSLSVQSPSEQVPPSEPGDLWTEWRHQPGLRLQVWEHSGLGRLELSDASRLLAFWRYTAARAPGAHRLVKQFEELQSESRLITGDADGAVPTCPRCGEILPVVGDECPRCGPTPVNVPTKSLVRLWQFAKPFAGLIWLGLVLTIAGTAAGLIPPYLTMPLLDKVLIPSQTGQQAVDSGLVIWYLSGMAGAAVLAWLLSWARTYVLSLVSELISAELRNRTYSHLQSLSLEFFGGKRTGDLMSRVGTDTDRICNFLSLQLLDFVADVAMILMTSAILLSIDPALAVVTLLPIPAIAWLLQVVRKRLLHGFRRSGVAWGRMTSVLADTIPGIRVVKAFAQERREIERFSQANKYVLDVNDRVNRVWAFFGPTVTFLTDLGLLMIWAFGAWSVLHGDLKVGVLTAFLEYIRRFYGRLESLSRMLAATQRAAASAQRIFEILDRVPTVAEPVHPVHPGRLKGALELRHVSFQYGNRKILEDINLSIRPGEMVGLVGPSGAGKSTLINLVCRFYDVGGGAILVDGTDIRSFPVQEYRHNIGLVLQESFLFYGTVAENISYGRPEATREEIVAAARAARAHEFILRLADGYDSLVGERGQSLSGGERQRIAIARALLTDPRILILDEATSSVDTETEHEIQEALNNLIQGRTTIAIAHRLSTLRKADRLVVMERGRIVEVGQHEELLKVPGTYARLHQAQLEMAQVTAI